MTPDLSVVIPTFDEVNGIGRSVERAVAFLEEGGLEWELLVVTDGGPPEMATLVERAARNNRRVQVLVNDHNRGKGFSVRRGVLASRGRVVAFLDADLAQPIESLPAFLNAISDGADVAIGVRTVISSTRPAPIRRVASTAFGHIARVVLGLPFRDTQCGMKAFKGDAGRALCRAQRLERFAFDAELLLIAQTWNLRVAEVPLDVEPPGASTVRLMRDGVRMLIELLHVRWMSSSGAYSEARFSRESVASADVSEPDARNGG